MLFNNHIMRCYNLFPYMFRNIDAMTDYLDKIKEMGFNTVWLNPIQDATNQYPSNANKDELANYDHTRRSTQTGFKRLHVRDSIYAMMDPEALHPEVFQNMDLEEAESSLKKFTTTAKEKGLIVLFDLVLLHVSKYSPLVTAHHDWFYPQDTEGENTFGDTRRLNYQGEAKVAIIDFWKTYIKRYIDYGFSGARIDCAQDIPIAVREELYSYMRSEDVLPGAIIFEETLFSDKPIKDYAMQVKNDLHELPNYNTGSAYFLEADWAGAFPRLQPHSNNGEGFVSHEDYYKSMVIKDGGVVNFTGNHDRLSATMQVLQRMALQHTNIYINHLDGKKRKKWEDRKEALLKEHDSVIKQAKLLTFLYPVRSRLLEEIIKPERNNYKELFITSYLMHLANMMFTESGGYYLLSGDESMCIFTPSVFRKGELLPHEKTIDSYLNDENIKKDVIYNATRFIPTQMLVETFFTYARQLKKVFNKGPLTKHGNRDSKKEKEIIDRIKKGNWDSSVLKDFCKEVEKLLIIDNNEYSEIFTKEALLAFGKFFGDSLKNITQFEEIVDVLFSKENIPKLREFSGKVDHYREEFRKVIDRFIQKKIDELLNNDYADFKQDYLKLAEAHINAQIVESAVEAATNENLSSIKGLRIWDYVSLSDIKVKAAIEKMLLELGNKIKQDRQQAMDMPSLHLWDRVSQGLDLPWNINKFIKHMNEIFSALPKPVQGFWSESFKTTEGNLVIVRVNGALEQTDRRIDLIILNLNPSLPREVGTDFIARANGTPAKKDESLAVWFVSRLFPFEQFHSQEKIEMAYKMFDLAKNSQLYVWLGPSVFAVDELKEVAGDRVCQCEKPSILQPSELAASKSAPSPQEQAKMKIN